MITKSDLPMLQILLDIFDSVDSIKSDPSGKFIAELTTDIDHIGQIKISYLPHVLSVRAYRVDKNQSHHCIITLENYGPPASRETLIADVAWEYHRLVTAACVDLRPTP